MTIMKHTIHEEVNTVRKHHFYFLFLSTIILLCVWLGCSSDKGKKIPITTSSKTALENYLKGRELVENLQLQKSISYWEKAIAEDPEFAMAYYNMALVSPTAKGFFENLNKAADLTDKISDGERLIILGAQAAANGFPMKQKELLTELVMKYPKDERAHDDLGNYYYGVQDYALAVNEYRTAGKINPKFPPLYNELGYAYRLLGQYTEAEDAFKKYISLIPDDPNPYDSYAELLMKIGKYNTSIDNYRKALTIDPNFVASHIGIATDLNFKNKHEEAREQLMKLQAIARDTGERRAAHFATAVSYADEGKLDKALDEIKKEYIIASNIEDANAMSGDLITMGDILLEMGQADKAAQEYEDALKVSESSNLSNEVKKNARRIHLYNIGRVALQKKEMPEAKANASEFLKDAENMNNIFLTRLAHELLGIIALNEKEYNKAIEELEQANLQNPYNLYRLYKAYAGQGNQEKSREYLLKTAKFNALNDLNYAFIRVKAQQELEAK